MRSIALAGLLVAGGLVPAQEPDARAKVEAIQKRIELLTGDEVRREIDPGVLAASLGHDVGKLFGFARQLPLHPYSGALRGAAGALLAGAANDVDRCLLLKEMLQGAPAKPAVRFAFGELTQEQGAALAARTLRSVPGMPGFARVKRAEVLARIGGTEGDLASAEARVVKSAQARVRTFDDGFGADRAAIEGALKDAGAVPSGSPEDSVAAAARILRSHVWLQVEREGQWVNLDPSFPDAAVGWAPVAVARTSESLPEDLVHRLSLRLFVERREGNKLEADPVYASTRPLSDLAGRAINVSVLPMGYEAEKTSEPLDKQLGRFTKFQPVIDFGGVKENSRVFDVQGRVFQSKDGKFGNDFADAAGGRVLGAFGRKPATSLSAVSLEIEIAAPGRRPHVERRYLLDRLPPGSRAGGKVGWDPAWEDDVRFRLALFKSWTIWPAAGMLNDSFLVDRLSRLLARDGGLPRVLFETVDAKAAPKLSRVAEHLDPLPMGLVEVWQTALGLAQGAFEPGEGACFPDGASLLVWKEELAPGEKGGIRWRGGADILHAPLGCVAKAPAAAARARLLFGLLLSEGESTLMEGRPGDLFSAAAVFRKARAAKIPLVLLRGRLEGVTLDARVARRVEEDLKAGRAILIPREAVPLGGRSATAWWRVDPVTGACLGIGDTGEGQAVSEGQLVLDNISIPMVQRCMKFVVCLNMGIGAGRSMQDAGRECMTEFMKDYIKDTVDGAISHFVMKPLKEKAEDAVVGGVGLADPQLAKMYKQAKETWGATNEAIDDLTFSGLRAKAAILLDMGNEIARYAHEKGRQGR